MCLVVDKKSNETLKPLIAEEEIIVYKFYIVKMGRVLISPFQKNRYFIGAELPKQTLGIKNYRGPTFNVYEGYHSFDDKQDAVNCIKEFHFTDYVTGVFKCIIPKGSEYYKGTFNENKISYASDNLKIISQCV